MSRPDWDSYFMKICLVTAERSTCHRHHVGALIVNDRHRILSGGYNGAPAGHKDCLELGCLRDALGVVSGERTELCRAVHAEENAIIQAAQHGVGIRGATMYCLLAPCRRCAKMLCNAGIVRVVVCNDYADTAFRDLFVASHIEFVKIARPDLTITELL